MLIDKHLEELASLHAEGVIDEDEYRMLKLKVQTETRTEKEMP
ncbi:MAG: SHOCT domain-containing protein [Bacteroidetes bacterium]|nr:SHOCT domain-containing protein [Bacteroidota bacterium]